MTFNGGFVMISGYNSKCQGKIHLFKDPLRVCFCSLLEILFPLFSALFWALGNGTLELASPALWILLGSANERQEQVIGGQEKGKSRVLLPQLIFPTPLLPVSLHVPEVAVSISSRISVEQILLQSSHWKTGSGQHSGPCLSLQAWEGQWLPHSCHSQGAPSLLTDSFNSA